MTGYVTDYMIIKFYNIIIAFFLDANSDERIGIWDYSFINEEKTS